MKIRQTVFSFWSFILFFVTAGIIIIPAINEFYSSRQALIQIWKGQGQLLSETILRSASRISSFDLEAENEFMNRLLDLGRHIRQLDSLHSPSENQIKKHVRRLADSKAVFFSRDGKIRTGHFRGRHGILQGAVEKLLKSPDFSGPVTAFPIREDRPNSPAGIIVERIKDRGYIVLLPSPRHSGHAGKSRKLHLWLEHLTSKSSIEYILLFRDNNTIGQSGNVPKNIKIPDVRFPSWNITEPDEKNIFEYSRMVQNGTGILIGLSAEELTTLQKNLVRRLVISSVILLILGIILIIYIIKRHSYGLLQQKYEQVQTYSESILENMDEAIIMLDSDGQISIFNKAAENLFGIKASDALNKRLINLPLNLPDDLSVKLISSKTFHELPVFFESPSGSRRLLVSARPLAYSSSQPDQQTENLYLILFHDNTTQKELEDLRSRRNKLMAMGGLASKMAHEIRNPLNGIGMLAQRLVKEFQPKINEEEYKQMTQSIRQESKRINEIVETFLNYARTPELKFKKTDLKTLLESDSSLLQSICRVPLQMDLDEGCYINADADQIKQALINLVKNACEASPENVPVKIFCRKEADRIRLCVEDSGSGIPAEIQDKVFDLYFTTKSSGMGLGLSIVEKIISAHQGRALVESPYFADGQTQQGARFIIDFPSQN